MKKRLILLTAIGIVALLASCDGDEPIGGEEPQGPQGPFPVGEWRAVHKDFEIIVNGSDEIKAEREKKISIDIPKEGAYLLEFNKNGKGWGSGLDDESELRKFVFEWALSDNGASLRCSYAGYMILVTGEYSWSSVHWTVEEYSTDKMVLSTEWSITFCGLDWWSGWEEFGSCRYTFERVVAK